MRRSLLGTLLALILAAPAGADVAFDAFDSGFTTSQTQISWTHTPSGTPRAVIIWVQVGVDQTDIVGTVTYGATTMPEVTPESPQLLTSGEGGSAHLFFLGSGIPTGAQTVTVPITGGGPGIYKAGYSVTLTASDDTEVVDVQTINDPTEADPAVTMSLGGRTSFVGLGGTSGHNTVGDVTPYSGWTNRAENDAGNMVLLCYTYDTIGTSDVTAGWDQSTNDVITIPVAVSEKTVAVVPKMTLIGIGP